jgi:hypothetical protein
MRLWLCLLIFALSETLMAGDHLPVAHYVGGTVQGMSADEGVLDLTGEEALEFRTKAGDLRIPYENVLGIEYGQQVDRRYIMAVAISPLFLLSKKRKHYVTLHYTDEAGRQQALVLRVDKKQIRAVLAGLEAKTGRRVEYQDAAARKAAKG